MKFVHGIAAADASWYDKTDGETDDKTYDEPPNNPPPSPLTLTASADTRTQTPGRISCLSSNITTSDSSQVIFIVNAVIVVVFIVNATVHRQFGIFAML